jgi:hypothetical protein
MRLPRVLLAALLATAALPAGQALAWGNYGHRMIGQLGAEAFGPEIPAFLRTRKAIDQIGELAREPDRSKGAGQPHDADADPEHFVDLSLDGTVLGGPRLDAMPRDRKDYEAALRKVGENSSHAGTLYYSLVDGWQHLAIDFAYWRLLKAGERSAKSAADRAYFKKDRELRELLILRDLGFWAHYVGDSSQPLHVSEHYNGWGDGPNPEGYTKERIHSPVEARFVERNVVKAKVKARLYAPETCAAPIQTCVARHLLQSGARVEPTYRLWAEGGFNDGDARGVAFTEEGLAMGASRLRDYVAAAWRQSGEMKAGYPNPQSVKEVEAGKPLDRRSIVGDERGR